MQDQFPLSCRVIIWLIPLPQKIISCHHLASSPTSMNNDDVIYDQPLTQPVQVFLLPFPAAGIEFFA